MKLRAFLIGALLASSAGAQEPSFDLRSDAIKKIVLDTAASQSVPVQLAEPRPVERKRIVEAEDLRPLETPAKVARPRPVAAAKSHQGPIAALFEAALDHALGVDNLLEEPLPFCLADVRFKNSEERVATCKVVPGN